MQVSTLKAKNVKQTSMTKQFTPRIKWSKEWCHCTWIEQPTGKLNSYCPSEQRGFKDFTPKKGGLQKLRYGHELVSRVMTVLQVRCKAQTLDIATISASAKLQSKGACTSRLVTDQVLNITSICSVLQWNHTRKPEKIRDCERQKH
jgi:hypothetical protein